MRLFIAPVDNTFWKLYDDAANAYNATPYESRNSGFDLFCNGEDIDEKYSATASLIGQGCRALAVDTGGTPRAYWLSPRSSISKTPWRLANSLGLMDATYRGVVKAAVFSVDSDNTSPNRITLHGQRLVQLVQPDLMPWDHVSVILTLPGPDTLRGEGGFGSTGNGAIRSLDRNAC
jgi:dUTP pyrophosphatase